MSGSVSTGFPGGPVVDATSGDITPAWRGFFIALYNRTGSAPGVTPAGLQANIDAEAAARAAGDAHLQSQIGAIPPPTANAVIMQTGRSASDSSAVVRVTLPTPYTTKTLTFQVDGNPVEPNAYFQQQLSDVMTMSLVTGKLVKLDVSSGTVIDVPGVAFTWYATGV